MSITHFELPLNDAREVASATHERHLTVVPAPVAAPAAALRLTRRGRVAVVIAALLLLVGLAVVFGSGTAATGESGVIVDTASITVQPGQTLWSIAAVANPDGDIRDTVDDIVRLNSLADGASLQMGSKIAVPVYSD